jgi:hypothetical protein
MWIVRSLNLIRKRFRILTWLFVFVLVVAMIVPLASYKRVPQKIQYGMSYNAIYARELGLDTRKTFLAILDELRVKRVRLAAHWTLVESERDVWNWEQTDFELAEAKERNVDVIMGVGRRLPRWPECHIPEWAKGLSFEDQKKEIRELITESVRRYKDNPSITYWQVENEPFLNAFANEHCGDLDVAFLHEEIQLVRSLDPTRPILVTDSGNLGTWHGAYRAGDAFGTSVYVYFWNPEFGKFTTFLPPWFYRLKDNAMQLLFGKKTTMLIELSLEPWLIESVTAVPLDVQFTRMNPEIADTILEYARNTRYEYQYLWGAEWWYWLHTQGHHEMWNLGKELYFE